MARAREVGARATIPRRSIFGKSSRISPGRSENSNESRCLGLLETVLTGVVEGLNSGAKDEERG